MRLNGKNIDDFSIDGYGVDAFFNYATFEDGTELTEDELDQLTLDYPDVIHEQLNT